MVSPASETEVQDWLEWAGSKLLALRIPSPAPKGPHIAWPEYASSPDGYGYTKNTLRAAAPTRFEITLMDEILLLPNLIPDITLRRIVHARALVAPVSLRYVYSWPKIAVMVHSDRKAVARLHTKGLRCIAKALREEKASALRQSFHALAQ